MEYIDVKHTGNTVRLGTYGTEIDCSKCIGLHRFWDSLLVFFLGMFMSDQRWSSGCTLSIWPTQYEPIILMIYIQHACGACVVEVGRSWARGADLGRGRFTATPRPEEQGVEAPSKAQPVHLGAAERGEWLTSLGPLVPKIDPLVSNVDHLVFVRLTDRSCYRSSRS